MLRDSVWFRCVNLFRMGKGAVRKQRWLDTNQLADKHAVCARCREIKPAPEFWDSRKRQSMKTCQRCLQQSRNKKRVSRGRRTRVPYRGYIASPEWQQKRREYWSSDLPKECYVCQDEWVAFSGKELHHRTYARLGFEQLTDLVPVCPDHHGLITKAWNQERRLPKKTRRSLWEVTDSVRDEYRARFDLVE